MLARLLTTLLGLIVFGLLIVAAVHGLATAFQGGVTDWVPILAALILGAVGVVAALRGLGRR
jgi:hypothetical protein